MLRSMFAAPFLSQNSGRLALRFSRSEWMLRSLALHQVAVEGLGHRDHIIICGYGRTGQGLARFLEREGIDYVALDLDPERVRAAAAAGENVVYGDSSRRETLVAAGLSRAKAVVVSFIELPAAIKVLAHVRSINTDLPTIVRTRDDSTLERLTEAGATEVVPDTFESSLMLASHALLMIGVPMRRVLGQVRGIRNERYRLLRGFYRGAGDEADDLEEAHQPRLLSVSLEANSYAVGRTLAELNLVERGVEITAVRRRGIRAEAPQPETRFQAGDVLVMLGGLEALEAVKQRMTRRERK
jgi:CPA2 family monovalent cation:H+ antiporter-2